MAGCVVAPFAQNHLVDAMERSFDAGFVVVVDVLKLRFDDVVVSGEGAFFFVEGRKGYLSIQIYGLWLQ